MLKKVLKNPDLWFSILVLVLMEVSMTMQVICRYIFKSPLPWTDAFCAYGLVLIICFGSIYVYRTRTNLLGFYALRDALPRWGQCLLLIIFRIVAMVVFGLITISFYLTVIHNPNTVNQYLASLPYWAYFGPGVISFGSMTILSVIYMIRDFRALLSGSFEFENVEEENRRS